MQFFLFMGTHESVWQEFGMPIVVLSHENLVSRQLHLVTLTTAHMLCLI